MSCSSVDIPRLLTGNECIPYRPLNPGSCVVCRKSTGNQDCCKSLVSQFVCQAKCRQCQQLPGSLQQLCCQHKRCKNQSSPLSFPSSPLKVAILEIHPFSSFIYHLVFEKEDLLSSCFKAMIRAKKLLFKIVLTCSVEPTQLSNTCSLLFR